MIALGIDPGTRRIGYGVVECNGSIIAYVTAGILAITSTEDVPALEETKKGIDALIKKHKPDVVAIEKLFLQKIPRPRSRWPRRAASSSLQQKSAVFV